jgi:sulfite reductase (NADPH) flavoprotein alpha-component
MRRWIGPRLGAEVTAQIETPGRGAAPDEPASARSGGRRWHLPALPTARQAWFQLHWFIGITAGTVLMLIGLSGAVLSFREELIDALNPGARAVPLRALPALSPPQLLTVARLQYADREVGTLAVFAAPGAAARIIFAPAAGQQHGDTVYLDPYTGNALAPVVGAGFFEWIESFHRWLLLPRAPGQAVAGTLSVCLLFLSLSGLYLRWPRRPADWRAWLTFDPSLKGRPFLWGLHAVAGACALVMYLVFTTTGIYWAFDVVRERVDAMAGEVRMAARPPRAGGSAAARRVRNVPREDAGAFDISPAWRAFERRARATGGWSQVILRVQGEGRGSVLFTWLDAAPAHERARNRMVVRLADGEVEHDDRHHAKSRGGRLIAAIYPLHMGSYLGLPGRVVMTLAALMLPLFGVTGWMLYLDRRRRQRALRAERAALDAASPATGLRGSTQGAASDPILLAFASQSGTAEGIALRSAAALEGAGVAVKVAPLGTLSLDQLRHHRRVLIVASTFGEGGPPDSARRFARQLDAAGGLSLASLRVGILALGDRHYERFCGFGRILDHALSAAGAVPLFPMTEVDDGDPVALAAWQRQLARLAGAERMPAAAPTVDDWTTSTGTWRLAARRLLNPGSVGNPLYEIELVPEHVDFLRWEAGALVALRPPRPVAAAGSPDLSPLAPRRYSIASLPRDGHLRLLVRQARHESGLGIASGWLTVHAALDTAIELRVLRNPGFAPTSGASPCIFIGNGSGYAGLRAHLRVRIESGHRRNWLLFGERERAHDAFCLDEIERWQAEGCIERADVVFSRDQAERVYVQDRLRAAADALRAWIGQGAVIYVCGSLNGMAAGVDAALLDILGRAGLDDLIAEGRYRRDVY